MYRGRSPKAGAGLKAFREHLKRFPRRKSSLPFLKTVVEKEHSTAFDCCVYEKIISCLLAVLRRVPSQPCRCGWGTLTSNTVWSPALGTIMVFSNVVIPASITLTIEAGTTVQLSNSISIQVQKRRDHRHRGNSSNIVHLVPMVGNNNWGTINSSGASSHLTVRFAELAHGGISLSSGASGLIEDSYLHDYGSEIVGNSAGLITMRRIHVNNYSETIFNSGTVVLAEDSLFENILIASGDAFEIQMASPLDYPPVHLPARHPEQHRCAGF